MPRPATLLVQDSKQVYCSYNLEYKDKKVNLEIHYGCDVIRNWQRSEIKIMVNGSDKQEALTLQQLIKRGLSRIIIFKRIGHFSSLFLFFMHQFTDGDMGNSW